jgi:uncharacterized membrane protein YhaH (DUF805 family)
MYWKSGKTFNFNITYPSIMFQNPFSFEGRVRRTEYCLSYILFLIGLFGAFTLLTAFGNLRFYVFLFACIPAIWFFWAQGAKRCHDRGNSGWFQLIPFYRLWMMFADSDYGPNEYGSNPKGDGNEEEY